MANGKYSRKRGHRGAASKTLTVILAVCLLIGTAVGGTIAWLTSTPNAITNTFTVSDVEISLSETTGETYQMVPGVVKAKDPMVTIKANSLESWVFVKIEESATVDDFLTYSVITGTSKDGIEGEYWISLDGVSGVYYCKADATGENDTVELPVIYYDADGNGKFDVGEENKVYVKETVTKDMMEKVEKGTIEQPTLTFTAYAIQQPGFATAADAWKEVSK